MQSLMACEEQRQNNDSGVPDSSALTLDDHALCPFLSYAAFSDVSDEQSLLSVSSCYK